VAAKERAVLYLLDQACVKKYDDLLWTYSSKVFLAHGSQHDNYAHRQPVFITTLEQVPNQAAYVVIIDGVVPKHLNNFKKCLDIFDGNDEEQVAAARLRYKKYKQEGYVLKHWQQNSEGVWENNQ
jgi:DNA polymerase-3 subunit chi